MAEGPVGVGVVGIDHRHIFGMLDGALAAGARAVAWWSPAPPSAWEEEFVKRHPDLPRRASMEEVLEDDGVELALLAGVPCDRAGHALAAMRAGKDVMVDKPGCTTLAQLAQLREAIEKTGRIWSVNFSERFEVPAVTRAKELVDAGAIGKVVQTVGLGPHRHNPHTRREWFYQREKYGGILCDIASHQIDQFFHFTGAADAAIAAASVANHAHPEQPGFEDFGELLLQADGASGYIRVDWHTPDGLPTWGDGRLFILGTEGYIELRKYVDVARSKATDNLFLVNRDECRHIDCADAPLPYFSNLLRDVRERTATAMPQEQPLRVMELAIRAQLQANGG